MWFSGVASIGARGAGCPLDSEKIVKNLEKEGENRENKRKNWENIEKKMKNREEKAKIGKVLSHLPLLTNRAGYATGVICITYNSLSAVKLLKAPGVKSDSEL